MSYYSQWRGGCRRGEEAAGLSVRHGAEVQGRGVHGGRAGKAEQAAFQEAAEIVTCGESGGILCMYVKRTRVWRRAICVCRHGAGSLE